MEEIRNYKDLVVWKKSLRLSQEIYTLTNRFPKDELYGLISQIRRCSVSIPSNIAEGNARGSVKDYVRFLYIARGSLAELDTQLCLAESFGYCTSIEYQELQGLCAEISKRLTTLILRLQNKETFLSVP